jgi:hypothetical protein
MAVHEGFLVFLAWMLAACLPPLLTVSPLPSHGGWALLVFGGIVGWSCWSGLRAREAGHGLTFILRTAVPLTLLAASALITVIHGARQPLPQ